MDQPHDQDSDLASTLKSVIESSVGAALQRLLDKSSEALDTQIEKAVNSALERRLGPSLKHSEHSMDRTALSIATVEPVMQADAACQPFVSADPPNSHSQYVPEMSQANPSQPAASNLEGPAPVSKPGSWDIVDLTELIEELPEELPGVTSSTGRGNANEIDSLMFNGPGFIGGEERQGHPATASEVPVRMIRERRESMQKRSFEDMEQRAQPANREADIKPASHRRGRVHNSNDTASQEVDSYDSEATHLTAPPVKRAKKKTKPPGYTTGPPIKFLKVCSQLTAAAGRQGWPRVVDLEDFMHESNKQNLTMADIVATILWNHAPETLEAFLDFKGRPEFRFERRGHYLGMQECWISRYLDEEGVVTVACGTCSLDDLPQKAWEIIKKASLTYHVAENGTWELDCRSQPSSKRLQNLAIKLGTRLFFDEVWVETKYAVITVT